MRTFLYLRNRHWLFLYVCLTPVLWAQIPAAQSATPHTPEGASKTPGVTPEQVVQGGDKPGNYEHGNYEQALAVYDAIIKKGNAKAAIFYNRAATLYKLNRLPQAQGAFAELLRDTQWTDLARYNLGLIAERQGTPNEALKWYQQIQENTSNARLRTIAERKILHLSVTATAKPAPIAKQSNRAQKNTLLMSVGAVVDDNATRLAEELSGSSSRAKDTYLQGMLYGHTFWGSNKVYGLAQVREFQKFDTFDTRVAGVGMERIKQRQNWQLRYGLRALNIAVANGTLANQFSVNLTAQKQWANNTLELRNNLSQFDTTNKYRHLQGWQNQLQASWQKKWGKFSLKPQLGWEINNRKDKTRTSTFYSYSPAIFSGQVNTVWDISAAWQLRAEAEWAQANYDGVNRLTDIGGINKEQARQYDRTTLSLGARYRLHRRWYLKLDYQHAETDDVFALYSFSKNTLAAKIEFVH